LVEARACLRFWEEEGFEKKKRVRKRRGKKKKNLFLSPKKNLFLSSRLLLFLEKGTSFERAAAGGGWLKG